MKLLFFREAETTKCVICFARELFCAEYAENFLTDEQFAHQNVSSFASDGRVHSEKNRGWIKFILIQHKNVQRILIKNRKKKSIKRSASFVVQFMCGNLSDKLLVKAWEIKSNLDGSKARIKRILPSCHRGWHPIISTLAQLKFLIELIKRFSNLEHDKTFTLPSSRSTWHRQLSGTKLNKSRWIKFNYFVEHQN